MYRLYEMVLYLQWLQETITGMLASIHQQVQKKPSLWEHPILQMNVLPSPTTENALTCLLQVRYQQKQRESQHPTQYAYAKKKNKARIS